MKASTSTFGGIGRLAGNCTSNCAEHASSGANATGARTAGGGWVARGRSASDRAASQDGGRWGPWEIDTVHGRGGASVGTLVEGKSGDVAIGKLAAVTVAETNAATLALLRRHRGRVRTITADNGTEFHGYRALEEASGVQFYFATPHHAWERGTSENTNGLIRQSCPKELT